MRPKFIIFNLQIKEESDFLHAVAIQIITKLDINFNLTFKENRTLLFSPTAKVCYYASTLRSFH